MLRPHAFVFALPVSLILAGATAGSGPALAEGLSGPEFKKLVVGNTLKRTNEKGERRIYRFLDDERLVYVSPDSKRHPEPLLTTWTVSDAGEFCWMFPFNDRRICYTGFETAGGKLVGRNPRSANKLEFTLVKGLEGFDPTTAKRREIVAPSVDEIRKAFAGHTATMPITRGEMKLTWQPGGVLHREIYRDSGELYEHTGSWSVKPDGTYCQWTGLGESCFQMEKDGDRLWRLRDGMRVFEPIPLKK